jgi:hypothetical protein
MQKTEELFSAERIEITWKYEEEDEDIQIIGEEFKMLSKGNVNVIAIENY